jgi:hypothetical protein
MTLAQRSSRLEDDARSANPYFISLAALEAGRLAGLLKVACQKLEAVKHMPEDDPSRLKAELSLVRAEARVNLFRKPRFFDDLESVVYCLLHQVRLLPSTFQSLKFCLPVARPTRLLTAGPSQGEPCPQPDPA